MTRTPKTSTTTVRLPPALHEEIKEAAGRNAHSMNHEIVERLQTAASGATLRDIMRQNERTQAMLQQIIDALSPRR